MARQVLTKLWRLFYVCLLSGIPLQFFRLFFWRLIVTMTITFCGTMTTKSKKWTTTPTTASDNCNIHAKLAQFNSSLYEGINSYGRWWTLETGAVRAPLWNISQYQEWFNYRWSIIPHHHDCRRRINVLIFHTYTHYYAVCATSTAMKTDFLSFLSFSSSPFPLQ